MEIKYFCKCFQMAMIPRQELWNTIVIVIAFDSLHKDFDTTIASLLEVCNKIINQIQSILQSKETENISKQAIGRGISNLSLSFRDKNVPKKGK